MIWNLIKNFFVRYWHWVVLLVGFIVVSVFTVKQFDSARVYIFGPADKVTVRVK